MKTWFDINLAVGLCNSQNIVYSDFFWNFLNLRKPKNTLILRGKERFKFIALNNIVDIAYAKKAEKILFMDIDMKFPVDTIPKLLSYDLPIVSGIYYLKTYPFSPIAGYFKKKRCVNFEGKIWKDSYSPLSKNSNNLVEVDWVGIGCLLVDMEVFTKIKFPCFKEQWSYVNNVRTRGHDIIFCDAVKKAGYKIYVDTTIDCIHYPADIELDNIFVQSYYESNIEEKIKNKSEDYILTGDYWNYINRNERISKKNRYYKSQYAHVMQFIPENSKVADIGCGRGLFLRVLKDQKHCECFGYDLSQEAINEIQSYGIRGKAIDFASYSPNGTEHYDFCVVSHVIEHLKDEQIDPFIQNVKKIMKEQAEAFFLVPTFEKRGELWLEHRRIYNQKSLSELLLKYFRNVSIKKIDKGLVAKVNNLPQLTLTE